MPKKSCSIQSRIWSVVKIMVLLGPPITINLTSLYVDFSEQVVGGLCNRECRFQAEAKGQFKAIGAESPRGSVVASHNPEP